MDWERFRSIVDQLPNLKRAVLHGVGEPMLVKALPKMVRYLSERNVYVLFNTNGTVLNERSGRALIAAGLDELRVSLGAATRESFKAVRGKDYFDRILANVRRFRMMQEREGAARAGPARSGLVRADDWRGVASVSKGPRAGAPGPCAAGPGRSCM
jgi:MoaA/NifB/PqqE/SkfB family radical SAM enzyme